MPAFPSRKSEFRVNSDRESARTENVCACCIAAGRSSLSLPHPPPLTPLTPPHPLSLTISPSRRCGTRHPCSSSRLSSIPLSCGARLRCIAGPGTTPIRHPFPLPLGERGCGMHRGIKRRQSASRSRTRRARGFVRSRNATRRDVVE